MAHKTGITLRLSPEDRIDLETLQAFTHECTATKALGIAIQHDPDTLRGRDEESGVAAMMC